MESRGPRVFWTVAQVGILQLNIEGIFQPRCRCMAIVNLPRLTYPPPEIRV